MLEPTLFSPTWTLTFRDYELTDLRRREITGGGGLQVWTRMVIGRMEGRTVEMTDEELLRTARYAYDYGAGGPQDALKLILRAARRAGWRQVADATARD